MGGDFVNVKLTAFGESLKQVIVHDGGTPDPAARSRHSEFIFRPGDVKRVTRAFEWEKVLRPQEQDGKPLFEITEEIAPLQPIFETTEEAAHDPRIVLPTSEQDMEVK